MTPGIFATTPAASVTSGNDPSSGTASLERAKGVGMMNRQVVGLRDLVEIFRGLDLLEQVLRLAARLRFRGRADVGVANLGLDILQGRHMLRLARDQFHQVWRRALSAGNRANLPDRRV